MKNLPRVGHFVIPSHLPFQDLKFDTAEFALTAGKITPVLGVSFMLSSQIYIVVGHYQICKKCWKIHKFCKKPLFFDMKTQLLKLPTSQCSNLKTEKNASLIFLEITDWGLSSPKPPQITYVFSNSTEAKLAGKS